MSPDCVCGCPDDVHIAARISVDLPAGGDPIYPVPNSIYLSAVRKEPTYFRRECTGCGKCMDYLADT